MKDYFEVWGIHPKRLYSTPMTKLIEADTFEEAKTSLKQNLDNFDIIEIREVRTILRWNEFCHRQSHQAENPSEDRLIFEESL